ncbi:hypothetical protein IAT38_005901 [Cryptococcus sp. DSM 104549]
MAASSPPLPPPSSLTDLATTLDAHSPSSTPSFLNHLLSPLLPPSLPAPNAPSPPSLPPIDSALQDLLTQLSLLSQDTASSLEQAIHEVGRTVPRLAYDLQFMRESASGLQASLSMVQDRVARQTDLSTPSATKPAKSPGVATAGESDAQRTHRALDKLTHLDTLKTRLESARDILREAESWSTLESELTSLLASREYAKAGHRLREASRSMVVFRNTPAEWEERKRLLVSLENELETAVGKALRDALGEGDVEGCRGFYEVFEDMEREEEFRGYYLKERGKAVVGEWKEAVLLESGEGVGEEDRGSRFASWLPRFYSTVLNTLTAEVDEIPLIFPPNLAPSVLATFVQTTFDALDPSFTARLSAAAEHHGAEALPEVIRAWKATEELGVAVQGLLDRMAFNTQGGTLSGGLEVDSPATATTPHAHSNGTPSPGIPAASPSPNTPLTSTSASAHSRSMSMARSSSHRASVSKRFSRAPAAASTPTPVGMEWETTLYEPFLDLQSGYASMERRYLDSLLASSASSALTPASKGKGKDAARALVERAGKILAHADDAVGRCAALTLGFGAVGLVSALEGYLSGFLERERTTMLELARSRGSGGGKPKADKDELDFEGLDYSTEDWGSFQVGLHVLEACREVSGKLGGFEGRLRGGVGRVGGVLKAAKGGEGWDGKTTTWGAVSLLQQSTLNSAELHQLVAKAAAPTTTPASLLPRSTSALEGFTRAAQLHLQSIILSPLLSSLSAYPTLSIWSKPDKAPRKGELQVPKFSLSPTDVISRVSEGLLDLLRVFEVWAGESGLAWSLRSLPFVEGLQLELPQGDAPPPPETVLSTWISSLALTLLSHLTSTTLPAITSLSTSGQAQLQTDLAYLGNAVRALDVEWEELGRWEAAVGMDEAGWRREREGDEVVKRVGRMRGWRV